MLDATGSPAKPTRRSFLKTIAGVATSFPMIVPASALGRDGAVAPSERITLGVMGIGPRCRYVLNGMLSHNDVQCVAVADVQASRRATGKKHIDQLQGNNACEVVRDFRTLLDRDDIDAMLIATGDRWHATGSMLATEAGKDVYSEKPCGITIDLCQRLDESVRRNKRIFQAGTQRRSVANFGHAVQLAHSGKLGQIHTLFATVYVPEIRTEWLPGQPTPPQDVTDWNMWLGPAPWRPFNQKYVDGDWRGYYDFDSGARLLDWGAHTVDLCQWANQADDTMPVEYVPSDNNVTCKYENGVTLVIEFLKTPFRERPGWIQSLGTCPVRFVGDEGSVETGDSGGIVVKPESLESELPNTKRVVGLDVTSHSRNFLDCIKSRKRTNANSQIMRRSHIACHAAALSWILKRTLRIDPATETFMDDAEANSLCSRPAREAWKV